MLKLDQQWTDFIESNQLQEMILQGCFGLEKENNRVDEKGRLAMTPHPASFGHKLENPYIRTDFSESQIEMITPVLNSVQEAYDFLEAIHDIVSLELDKEWLWPSSNPPVLPEDHEIPIASMKDPGEDVYRHKLAEKYGRKRQLMSGIHYNFSFPESVLRRLYTHWPGVKGDFKSFKDQLYLKIARNTLRNRWFLIYLTGASPVFDKSYIDKCVERSKHLDDTSYYFPNVNSLRNSMCGYRNDKLLSVSYDAVSSYVSDLQYFVQSGELLSEREYYSVVRLKPGSSDNLYEGLLQEGIAYLELRMIDLNPLYKNGISLETMYFIHLFLIFMLICEDSGYSEGEQVDAQLNHDSLIQNGIIGSWYESSVEKGVLQEQALMILSEMQKLLTLLKPTSEVYERVLQQEIQKVHDPALSFGEIVKAEIQKSTYVDYHMKQAKRYAEESRRNGYRFPGYEDLELSTQLLLKAAIKRGITLEILDRKDNFVALQKGDRREYVKQATKTSLDSYSTVLIMENKRVTKQILQRSNLSVPEGKVYDKLEQALADFDQFRGQCIVIKPNSTNFGLGITIFISEFSFEEYKRALELAFNHDSTILLEHFVSGREFRFLVMGNEVIGVLHRVPANVVGDGVHTIEELVSEKNKDSLRGEGYRTPLEFIRLGEVEEMFLAGQGKKKSDIPSPGEIVYLRENSNISTGGDSIDYTDNIHESYKELAIQAAKAAGATICGVDMIIDDVKSQATSNNYSIIELNFNPAIHIHCFPYRGKNRRADEKILDLLFGS